MIIIYIMTIWKNIFREKWFEKFSIDKYSCNSILFFHDKIKHWKYYIQVKMIAIHTLHQLVSHEENN